MKNQLLQKKKIFIFALLSVLAIGSYCCFAANKSNNDANNNDGLTLGEKMVVVQTQKVLPETITESIAASGVTEPMEKVEVSPQMSGKVSDIYFKEGDWIKAGQTIGRLEQDQNLLTAKNNALSGLRIAQTNLSNLVDSADQDIKAAEIAIETARIALNSAKTNGNENIKSSELAVEAALITLNNAEKSLENTEISGSQTIQDSYDLSGTTMRNNLITLNISLTDVGNILGKSPGNNSANDAYDNVLGVLNQQSLNDAKNYFPKAKNDYEDLVENINSLSSQSSYEEIDLAINSTKETLSSMSQMLFLTRILLDNTITASGFTSADLAELKSSVDFDRNSISAASSSLQAVQQGIINAKLKSGSGNDTARSAYDSAKTGLEQAEQNLVSVKLLSQSQIDTTQKQLESGRNQNCKSLKLKDKLKQPRVK
jgi:multidrug efflux pump subunit AcrA (membrane-fusion protein)